MDQCLITGAGKLISRGEIMSVNPGEKLVNKELQIYYIFCLSEVFEVDVMIRDAELEETEIGEAGIDFTIKYFKNYDYH
jgi:hypothetical protein